MSGIGIIANPHSKLNKRDPHRHRYLAYILGEKGHLAQTESLDKLSSVAEDFKRRQIDVLAINGGDGTISQTLTTFYQVYGDQPLPPIALLRGGTINVLASNLKIKGSPEKILFELVQNYSQDTFETKALYPLIVRDEEEMRLGFLFGSGAVSSFLKGFYRNKTNSIGSLLYFAKVFISGIFNGKVFRETVHTERLAISSQGSANSHSFPRKVEHETCALLGATIERMPLGAKFFPKTSEHPGTMELISFKMKPQNLLRRVAWQVLCDPGGHSGQRVRFVTESAEVQGPVPFDYSLDGDLYQSASGRITLETGRPMRFICPKRPRSTIA